MLHLIGDVVGILDALGAERAVVTGHNWGAPVAWNTALMRPDRVRGVIALSIPYRPRGSALPIATLRARFGEGFYTVYVQTPGVADAELACDVPATFRRWLYGASGDGPQIAMIVPPGGTLLDMWPEPDELPGWLTQQDIDTFAAAFADSGFTGALNWHRNMDRNWELTAPWHHALVRAPALFIAGERELHFQGGKEAVERVLAAVPNLRRTVLLPGCGHWVQQERPAEVSAEMIEFLRSLPLMHTDQGPSPSEDANVEERSSHAPGEDGRGWRTPMRTSRSCGESRDRGGTMRTVDTREPIRGAAAGVPYVALPPARDRKGAPPVVAWHLASPPRSETAMAAALPLAGLPAWRVYLGLPMLGSRLPDGDLEAFFRLFREDMVLDVFDPVTRKAVEEFPAALAELRERLPLGDAPLGLVAGSMGAWVALSALADTDMPVSTVALVSPAIRLASVVARYERLWDFTYPWSERSLAVAERLDFVARADEIAARDLAMLLVVGAGADDQQQRS